MDEDKLRYKFIYELYYITRFIMHTRLYIYETRKIAYYRGPLTGFVTYL